MEELLETDTKISISGTVLELLLMMIYSPIFYLSCKYSYVGPRLGM